jgi:hypothetical protein
MILLATNHPFKGRGHHIEVSRLGGDLDVDNEDSKQNIEPL